MTDRRKHEHGAPGSGVRGKNLAARYKAVTRQSVITVEVTKLEKLITAARRNNQPSKIPALEQRVKQLKAEAKTLSDLITKLDRELRAQMDERIEEDSTRAQRRRKKDRGE